MKTVTLCVLTRPCRLAELASIDYNTIRFSPEGATISPLVPPKQARAGTAMKDYFFPAFDEDINICPVSALRCYSKKTERHRQDGDHLFLTSTRPYHSATSATIARWVKTTLSKAGVDTSIFCAHSTRSASTSAAADAGISIPEILEAADWSSSTTFERFF